jgi:uncharacterized protein (DUF1330 family)
MKSRYVVGTAILAGIGIGVGVTQALHAQAKPPVYVVNEIDITDQPGFQKYADAQSKQIEQHGGRYIIRAGKVIATMDGTAPKGRFTVYVFDNQEAFQKWQSDSASLLSTRNQYGKFRSFAVEGLGK